MPTIPDLGSAPTVYNPFEALSDLGASSSGQLSALGSFPWPGQAALFPAEPHNTGGNQNSALIHQGSQPMGQLRQEQPPPPPPRQNEQQQQQKEAIVAQVPARIEAAARMRRDVYEILQEKDASMLSK